jgi:stress-induced morphogen
MKPSTFDPTEAMRTALAVASATFHGETDIARHLARAVDLRSAQFGLMAMSECLAGTIRALAAEQSTPPEEAWHLFCMRTDAAIERAQARMRDQLSESP